jgi:glucosamine 6-phosphate synthetase-like amidotransferase/phosphosugar isomerase protein
MIQSYLVSRFRKLSNIKFGDGCFKTLQKEFFPLIHALTLPAEHRPHVIGREVPMMPRTESTSEFQPLEDKEVEYFFASDASAVIEHTNRVIYLEVKIVKSF